MHAAFRSVALLPLGLTAALLSGQAPVAAPPRPRLGAAADTNDPAAYYRWGIEHLERESRQAAAAFYWAARLEPHWAEPLYAQRIALLLGDRRQLVRYVDRDRAMLGSALGKAADSLYFRALSLDPFLHRWQDRPAAMAFIGYLVEQRLRTTDVEGVVSRPVLDYYIKQDLDQQDPATSAWLAYTEGRFAHAADLYEIALRTRRDSAELRIARAHVFYHLRRYDSALAELEWALTARRTDTVKLRPVYQSNEMIELSIGILNQHLGRGQEAREAYQRALVENLGFGPARLRLAALRLEAGDTIRALAELREAIAVVPQDVVVRTTTAYLLAGSGFAAEALAHLDTVIAAVPEHAYPYYASAALLDALSRPDSALARYREFVARARRTDPALQAARERIAALGGVRR